METSTLYVISLSDTSLPERVLEAAESLQEREVIIKLFKNNPAWRSFLKISLVQTPVLFLFGSIISTSATNNPLCSQLGKIMSKMSQIFKA